MSDNKKVNRSKDKLRTRFDYIVFRGIKSKGKYQQFVAHSITTDAVLGWVSYYPAWRKFVFTSAKWAIFDNKCTDCISTFLRDCQRLKVLSSK